MAKTIIREDVNNPPIEVIADAIIDISQSIKKLREGRLNEKALLLLIQNATVGQYSRNDIKNVLNGIESLAKEYVKPAGTRK